MATPYERGLSPTSSLLPPPFMLSGVRAGEVLHTFILVGGVGIFSGVAIGIGPLLRSPRMLREPAVPFLGLVVFPFVP